MRQLPLPLAFNPQQGFDQFHCGPNGELVCHLRELAAGGPQPLVYLWGGPGEGKTHLLNACCRHAHQLGQRSACLPLSALKGGAAGILEDLDQLDLVCLDDLDAIAGDEAWELGLFALFNGLRDRGHHLLVSARQPPSPLPVGLADLKTRLEWGLTLHLAPLSDEDRMQVLQLQANALGLELPAAVSRFLMAHHRRDLTALRTLLEALDRATLAAQCRLTVPFVKAYLEQHP
jgi:DnaA family protein